MKPKFTILITDSSRNKQSLQFLKNNDFFRILSHLVEKAKKTPEAC